MWQFPYWWGGGTIVYGQYCQLTANKGYSSAVISYAFKPVVNAPGQIIARMVSGVSVLNPTITAGTVSRMSGIGIDEITTGSANTNLTINGNLYSISTTTNWSLYSGSTRTNLFAGPIQWGSNTGPHDLFGSGSPEGVKTAAVGSTYRRTDGGAGTSFYVKESGTGNTGWIAK